MQRNSCRNGCNLAFKGWSVPDIEKQCRETNNFHARFIVVIFCWEHRTHDSNACLVKDVKQLPGDPNTKVSSQTSTALQTKLMLGILCPPAVYPRRFNMPIPKGKTMKMLHNGEWLRGIILETSNGQPIGSV